MPNCKYCGNRVVNGVVLHSECYEELSKRADELGEELTAAMELVRKRDAKIKELVSRVTDIDVGNKSRTKKATEPWEETIDGIKCTVERKVYHDVLDVYTFTVPGWPECSVSGRRAARRTIRGRLDFAVRNTLGIDDPPKEVK